MLIVGTMYNKCKNKHYDIDISDKPIFCKDRSAGYYFKKNGAQDLVPSISRTDGFKRCFFNCIVKEWNSFILNHIREDNNYL